MAKKANPPKFFILLSSGEEVVELDTRAEVGGFFRDNPNTHRNARVILGHEFSAVERRTYTLVEGDLDADGEGDE